MKNKNILKKKYITKFISGFTIAEILISIMISSVLLAAMVPVIGIKKVKRPAIKHAHGIAECYYSGGELKAFAKGQITSQDDVIKKNGARCEFKVPPAEYLQIYVIGAGGKSGGNTLEISNKSSTAIEGDINIGTNYQLDIDAANSKRSGLASVLRDALNNWSAQIPGGLTASYKIYSPLGRGGFGKCQAVKISNVGDCSSYCSNLNSAYCKGPLQVSGKLFYSIQDAVDNNTGDYCWAYIHGKGQRSGYGMKRDFSVKIDGNTKINITENASKAGVSVLNGDTVTNMYLTASGAGDSPTFSSGAYTYPASSQTNSVCTSSDDSSYCSGISPDTSYFSYGSDRGQEPIAGITCSDYLTDDAKAKVGVVSFTSPTFRYKYSPLIYEVKQPSAGNAGQLVSKVYEKLSGTLYLYPASTNAQKSYIQKEGSSVKFLTADSGTNGTVSSKNIDITVASTPIVTNSRDVAQIDNEKVFSEYLSKINSLSYDGGLKNCQNGGTCPGFGGRGAYLYLEGAGLNSLNTLTIRNNQNGGVYTHKEDSQIHNNADGCADGEEKIYIDKDTSNNIKRYYCKPTNSDTNGNSGAIIIVW